MLLAGDIGGTKTDLAVYELAGAMAQPVAREEFPSGGYPDLESIVRVFLDGTDLPVTRACFAVAGPVMNGRANVTNLRWVLEEAQLTSDLGLDAAYLLNDLEAIAWAVPLLPPDAVKTLNTGEAARGGTIAVIAPGTGLGEAFLTWDGEGYRAHASEGGHADFAPTDDLQIGLLRYMMQHFDHVSYEMVCSGIGIPHIYAYLRDSGFAPESPDIAGDLAGAADLTPIIVQGAFRSSPCSLCSTTVETFVSILAAEAGNMAVKLLATGGVYLSGGLPLHVLPALERGRFVEVFRNKGRFSELMSRIPIHVVLHRTALTGAARYAFDRMRSEALHPAELAAAGVETEQQ